MQCYRSTLFKLEKNICMTSNIDIDVRCVLHQQRQCKDDRLPRIVASRCIRRGYHHRHHGLVVVYVVNVLLVKQGWCQGRRWRMTAPLSRRVPPRWRTTRTTTTTTAAQGMWHPPRCLDHQGRTTPTSPPDCCLFAPTLPFIPSSPRAPSGCIVPAPGEVEQRVPPL